MRASAIMCQRARRTARVRHCLLVAGTVALTCICIARQGLDSAFTSFGSGPSLHRLRHSHRDVAKRPKTARFVWEEAAADSSWMSDPIVSCVGWAALISGMTILRVATMENDQDTPESFLKLKGSQGLADASTSNMSQPVVCLGDSITRGNLSADWVSTLREQLSPGTGMGASVLNAGINMQCSTNVMQRIDEVIACCPSHVTVLVGTNDLKAELSPVEGLMYKYFGRLPEVPTLDNYERTLSDIRERLVAAGCRVALVSPPVLGEDIASEANRRAADFASVVRRVAETGGEHCAYLPLFECTYEALPQDGGRPYCGMSFFGWCCLLCWDVHIMRRDLSEIQRERDLGVTIDLVHLGPSAADQLAKMVNDFVTGQRGYDVIKAW
eukprot:CAMPEP_0197653554 /NCGR_PEP_ID=MMETSP1338-20131121/36079_1 /TAXON_ID=43686 ORGANISM="Pelagodinium beii, Strain RCC1491" /NCGR_SAMPLE_ID=MMETSP1338 /ASSEMBLY_ACC=CAM_ASM_000754 /LENGTH=383 /DNA_ID=CAMNT_0043228709 /DNA_START=62 /DNA_END=1211 /DNA_ORIENTATION=+